MILVNLANLIVLLFGLNASYYQRDRAIAAQKWCDVRGARDRGVFQVARRRHYLPRPLGHEDFFATIFCDFIYYQENLCVEQKQGRAEALRNPRATSGFESTVFENNFSLFKKHHRNNGT